MLFEIEKSILCSILEQDFISSDAKIVNYVISDNDFELQEHKLIAKAIIRLKELNEPICSDMVRDKYMSVNKWSNRLESVLLEIMIHNPFATFTIFDKYYQELIKHRKNKQISNILDGL